jgi:hypothetical protein
LVSTKNLLLGVEPVFQRGTRLIASLEIKFVRSAADAFFSGNSSIRVSGARADAGMKIDPR